MTFPWPFLHAIALSLLCAAGLSAETIQFTDLAGGLNTEEPGILQADNDSPSLQNVVIDESGGATRRKGYTRRNATAIGDGDDDVNSVFWLAQSDGDEFCVAFSSTTGYYSSDACATFTAFVSTLTRNNDVNCVPYADAAYCVNNQYEFRFNGANDIPFSGPGNSDVIQVHRNRCFAAGTDANPSRLFWSNLGDCNTWTTSTDYVDIDAEDGDVIIGIGEPLFGMLVIYKRYSTWVLKGDAPSNWFLVNASKNTGARSHRTVRNFGNVQLFDSLGPHGGQAGIYAFDGATIREVSRKIRSDIEALGFFGGTTGRKIIDLKADWDAGTFRADALSTARETGFLQSSYTTRTDTLGSDFGVWTSSSNVSTHTVTGSVTLAVATMTFADADDLSDWIRSGNASIIDNNTSCDPAFSPTKSGNLDAIHNGLACNVAGFDTKIEIAVSVDGAMVSSRSLTAPFTIGCNVRRHTIDNSQWVTRQGGLWKIKFTATNPSGVTLSSFESPSGMVPGPNVEYSEEFINEASDCDYRFSLGISTQYAASGNFTRDTWDTFVATPTWGTFTTTISSAADTRISFQVQSSTDSNDTFESLVTQSTGAEVTAAAQRYLRYRPSFASDTSTKTAQLQQVELAAASTGAWRGNELTLSQAMTSTWGLFSAQQTTSGSEASISYCVRASTFSGGAKYAPCVSQANNAAISASTGAFVIVESTITIGVATETAKIDSIVLNWNEGTISRQATAAIFKNRYHYGGQSPGATVNDVIYVMDTKGAWSKWTGVSPRHLNVIDQKFMMADSSTTSGGYVFQLYDSDADDGNAIEAFWESKDFSFGDAIKRKSVDRLYLLTSNDDTTLTATLKADTGIRSKAFSVNLSTGAAFKLHQVPVEGLGDANTFRLRVGNNAASKPWEVTGFGFSVRDLGLRQP